MTASEDGPPECVRLRRVSVQQESSSSRIFKKNNQIQSAIELLFVRFSF